VIGLVGGIGAGKSAAAEQFATLGAFVIDADKVGHALLDQRPVREQLVQRFGTAILSTTLNENEEEGETLRVDRRLLGSVVFKDPDALKALEAILHPIMRRTFEKAIDRAARKAEAKAVVIDAALLYEAGWNNLCDFVIFLDAPFELRAARVAAARGWNESVLTEREQVQWPLSKKKARADLVLLNDGAPDELGPKVALAFAALRPPSKPRPAPRPEHSHAAANGPRTRTSGRRGRR
jgi:dephospho-CoA kinase